MKGAIIFVVLSGILAACVIWAALVGKDHEACKPEDKGNTREEDA